MKSTLKKTLKSLFIFFGGVWVLRKLNQTPRVLFWHGVDDINDQEIEAESFSINAFQKQIEYLKKNYEIISIDEFYNRFQNQSFTNKEVVLTFDDGYVNNLTVVAPYLNEKRIPFTVFISTEHIETGELFPTSIARLIFLGSGLKTITIPQLNIDKFDISEEKDKHYLHGKVRHALKSEPLDNVRKIVEELKLNLSESAYIELTEKYKSVKPMSWDQVKQLHQLGATIGSHCKYHICCHGNQNINVVEKQIVESKTILEEKLKSECEFFAYPNGDFTENSNLIVMNAGYKMGFSVKPKPVEPQNNLSAMPRISAPLGFKTFKIIMALYPKK